MELNINITTSDKCKIVVQDVSTYLAEDFSRIVKGKFKYSDTISIDVLQHNQTLKAIYKEPIYTKHDNLKSIDSIDVLFVYFNLYPFSKPKSQVSRLIQQNILFLFSS